MVPKSVKIDIYGVLLWAFFFFNVMCSKVGPTPFCQPQNNMIIIYIIGDVMVVVGMSHVYSERNFFLKGEISESF